MSPDEHLDQSMRVLQDEGGLQSKQAIYEVNPQLFRSLNFELAITPDVLNPRSSELERAYSLDMYDKLVSNPLADQEEALRLLLATDNKTQKDPDKYISKQANTQPLLPGLPPQGGPLTGQPPQTSQISPPQSLGQKMSTLQAPR